MSEVIQYLVVFGFALLLVLGYVWLCLLVGQAAGRKGRSRGVWFVLALVFGVILPAIIVAIMAPFPSPAAISANEEQHSLKGETKQCPMCAEDIKMEARKCKHCGSMLESSDG